MNTKLTFSPQELVAAKNKDFFQHKKNITHAIYAHYGALIDVFKNEISHHVFHLPKGVNIQNGKISRGENYEGLPYIILDFPAFFSVENIFAVRNFFWWGHGFSMHFVLSNSFYKKYGKKIEAAKDILARNKFSICVSGTLWNHHFRKENYLRIAAMAESDFSRIIHEKNFIKIAANYSFDMRHLLSRQKKDFITLMEIASM